jgi:hypothetical protein
MIITAIFNEFPIKKLIVDEVIGHLKARPRTAQCPKNHAFFNRKNPLENPRAGAMKN